MILMIDNYDSFTYNLFQYLEELGASVQVVRNDAATVADILAREFEAVVISPGPGRPENAGIVVPLIRAASGRLPLLGVCLGHQAIASAFGGRVVPARRIMHGKTSPVEGDGRTLFAGIANPFPVMRYHSLAVERESLPDCLEVSATAADGEIMGLRHRRHPTEGIQFHPESIMTPSGQQMLANFLRTARAWNAACSGRGRPAGPALPPPCPRPER